MVRSPVAGDGDDVFAAIASPVRRGLLDALRAGPRSVGELAGQFPISRPAVSQHLAVLRAAGLVREDRAGRSGRYLLDPAPLRRVTDWVGAYEQFWAGRVDRLRALLDTDPDTGTGTHTDHPGGTPS
jgi:DNA-binding transcriptional ArsR family regulator